MWSWRALVVCGACAGCSIGAGPYQPGRAAYATAGAQRKASLFKPWKQADAHAQHVASAGKRVTSSDGSSSPMYDFDSAYYIGLKQGVSWTRDRGGPWSERKYMMEGHATVMRMVANDHLQLGVNVFAAGYGSTNQGEQIESYTGFGAEPTLKVGAAGFGLRIAGGALYGRASHRTVVNNMYMKQIGNTSAFRAAAAFDVVLSRIRGNDLVLAVEASALRVSELSTTDGPVEIEGVGLTFELVLSAF